MYRLFPSIPILLKGFFFTKTIKRMCIYDYVKNRIGTFKIYVLMCEKVYKRINTLGSCKTYCHKYAELHG